MKKRILILAVAIIAVCIAVFIFLLLRNNQESSTPKSSLPNIAIPTSDRILIPTGKEKKSISVNNYYKDPLVDVIDEKDVIFETSEEYSIMAYHYNNERSFTIRINASDTPLETARQNAENAFLTKLGIEKEQACSLSVSLYLSKGIEDISVEQYTYDYGLSFCPNGKPLSFFD